MAPGDSTPASPSRPPMAAGTDVMAAKASPQVRPVAPGTLLSATTQSIPAANAGRPWTRYQPFRLAHQAGESIGGGSSGAVLEWIGNALGASLAGAIIGWAVAMVVRRFHRHPEQLIVD